MKASFKLILSVMPVVLYKYLNCAVDKTNGTSDITNINFKFYCVIITLILSFYSKPLKVDQSGEICI